MPASHLAWLLRPIIRVHNSVDSFHRVSHAFMLDRFHCVSHAFMQDRFHRVSHAFMLDRFQCVSHAFMLDRFQCVSHAFMQDRFHHVSHVHHQNYSRCHSNMIVLAVVAVFEHYEFIMLISITISEDYNLLDSNYYSAPKAVEFCRVKKKDTKIVHVNETFTIYQF